MLQEVEPTLPEERIIKPPESGAPFNQVEEIIYRRRSVRAFKKKQVPGYLVRRIIEAGRYAPSAGNAQPWKFTVIQDLEMINAMTKDAIDLLTKLSKFVDYTMPGMEHLERRAKIFQRLLPNVFHPIPFGAIKQVAEGKLGLWHGAPTVILILVDTRSPGKPFMDVGIAGQNMVLAAHSLGIGTCWVSFAALLEKISKWKKKLGIKYPYKFASSIALGYSKGVPDGYVKRETQVIDWFCEDGTFTTTY